MKIGYDDRAVYIGAVCYDQQPERIARGISIRDQFPPGMNVDIFAVLISPYNDGLNSLFFYVTAAGVQRDVKFFGDQSDLSWDAVWDNILLRAKVKEAIMNAAIDMKDDDMLEAPFVIKCTDHFHKISDKVRTRYGSLDSEKIFFEWSEWLKKELKTRTKKG